MKNKIVCPKCGKEIDELVHWQTCEVKYRFYLDENGEEYYEQTNIAGGDEPEYDCPLCGSKLFTDEQDAAKFLKG